MINILSGQMWPITAILLAIFYLGVPVAAVLFGMKMANTEKRKRNNPAYIYVCMFVVVAAAIAGALFFSPLLNGN